MEPSGFPLDYALLWNSLRYVTHEVNDIHSMAAALLYALMGCSAIYQLSRLWTTVCKLDHQKLIFFITMGSSFARALLMGWKMTWNAQYPLWTDFLYNIPTLALFSAVTLLIFNWSKLYSTILSKQERNSTGFAQTCWLLNVFLWLSYFVALALSRITIFEHGRINELVPVVSLASLGMLGYFSVDSLLKYKNMRVNPSLVPASKDKKVVHHALAASACLFIPALVSSMLSIPFWNASPSFFHLRDSIWRFCELFQTAVLLTILSSQELALPPLPTHTRHLSKDWLTQVLQEGGILTSEVYVTAFKSQILTGGNHFKVSQVQLQYSGPCSAPKTIVVKLLSWDKTFWERCVLYAKKVIQYEDRDAMFLSSYQIESRFYTYYSDNDFKAVSLPKAYYNYEDCFNNKFGMVLEDISEGTETGQPHGFSWEDSKACVIALAKFHAEHWKQTEPQTKHWDIGAYWTGNKREGNKEEIRVCWDKAMQHFANQLNLKDTTRQNLGRSLEASLNLISEKFKEMDCNTLLHGDYKISNIFLGKKGGDTQVYVIDWQWLGVGNCAIDITPFIITSIRSEDIPQQTELFQLYHSTLVSQGITDYPYETFWRDVQICTIDFLLYIVCGKLNWMTQEDVRRYQRKHKDGLHLRSYPHMKNLIECAAQFLDNLLLSNAK